MLSILMNLFVLTSSPDLQYYIMLLAPLALQIRDTKANPTVYVSTLSFLGTLKWQVMFTDSYSHVAVLSLLTVSK